jgi:hypothetical protein
VLKDFKVTFKRSNQTIGSDIFTANTPSEVRHDFKEVYRHDIYEILSIEEVK